MKKLITLLCALVPAFGFSQSDTLLYENFDVDPTAAYALVSSGTDAGWVDFDVDGIPDANARPGNWYWSAAGFSSLDVTGTLLSSSWLNPTGQALNYLITPPLSIVDGSAVLNWKAAPYQTPLYLDGYKVLVSTTNNFEPSFTDTLWVAAEYEAGSGTTNGFNFSLYTFSPGFIHGSDTAFIEFDTDSSRFLGVMRPFSVSLAAYSGQTIYIAFLHDAFDDNIIGIDDILVTGNSVVGIQDKQDAGVISLGPNPTAGNLVLKYNLPGTSQVKVNIFDEKGALIKSFEKGMLLAGDQQSDINVSELSNGKYLLQLVAGNKFIKTTFVVAK